MQKASFGSLKMTRRNKLLMGRARPWLYHQKSAHHWLCRRSDRSSHLQRHNLAALEPHPTYSCHVSDRGSKGCCLGIRYVYDQTLERAVTVVLEDSSEGLLRPSKEIWFGAQSTLVGSVGPRRRSALAGIWSWYVTVEDRAKASRKSLVVYSCWMAPAAAANLEKDSAEW